MKSSGGIVFLALLAGSAVPATVGMLVAADFSLSKAFSSLWGVSFVVALAHAVFLGLPSYIVLSRRRLTQWWITLIAGFVIGATPYAVFTFPIGNPESSSTIDGETIHYIIDEMPTMRGWIRYIESVLETGLLGMCGGISAWATWKSLAQVKIG